LLKEAHLYRQSELTGIVTRVAKAFTTIPEEQSEHRSEEEAFTAKSQSEQAKALLEAGELLELLMVEVSPASWPRVVTLLIQKHINNLTPTIIE
jgi:hypothetical protein